MRFRERATGRAHEAVPYVQTGNFITLSPYGAEDYDGWIVWKDSCFVGYLTGRFNELYEPRLAADERGSD